MCGIVGIFGAGLQSLAHANNLLSHRGPDDKGLYIDQLSGIGLGHNRLSIIDTSLHGHQPMKSKDEKVILVFNGEIYNYKSLRSELIEKGFIFRGNSDTEVLLNLYLYEGESMLQRLEGIFAFAIWDSQKKLLFTARDALGVKPLYYTSQDNCFAFASELKALLYLVPDKRELDFLSLHRYLSFLWCPGRGTPLKSFFKLQPGEAIIVNEGHIQKRWIWYQLPSFREKKKKFNKAHSISETAEHLRQSVYRQMVSDVPLGAFLSGGLDSSAIVTFAREINPDIRCFTINTTIKKDGIPDDLPYAQMVAQHLDVPLDIVQVDSETMVNDIEKMVFQLDEPLADPAALNVLYISKLARENGIKVLLSGVGGDDLFTGYRRHLAVNYEKYWRFLPNSVRSKLEKLTKGLDQRNTLKRRFSKIFNGASLDGDNHLVNYFRWIRESNLLSLYTNDFANEINQERLEQPMLDFLKPLNESTSDIDRMLALEQRFFLSDHNLIYTDKMSMAAGVEVRVPFLDLELVNFAASIPVEYKIRGNKSKWILRKAMEHYLPNDVIYRSKAGFGLPLRRWMKKSLKPLLYDILSADSLDRRGLFSSQAVNQLIINNNKGKIDASFILFSIMCIEIWCRKFLDENVYTSF